MKKETISTGNGTVEVLQDRDLLYIRVFGEFTDNGLKATTEHLENIFAEIDGPTIRVWDTENITEGGYKVTNDGVKLTAHWFRKTKKKWPDNVVYLIGDRPLIYGLYRMYELRASDDKPSIFVVRSVDELPQDIQERIVKYS